MKLYHLDRYASICSENDLNLTPLSGFKTLNPDGYFLSAFSKGISHHGLNQLREKCPYIDTLPINGEPFLRAESFARGKTSVDIQIIETTFELVRRAHFPWLPSRFTSFFAVRRPEDFLQWPEMLDLSTYPNQKIFEIDAPDDTPCFDSSFLRGGLIFGQENGKYYMGCLPAPTADLAYRYWSGEASDTPRMEYLISLPIRAEQYREVDCSCCDTVDHQS